MSDSYCCIPPMIGEEGTALIASARELYEFSKCLACLSDGPIVAASGDGRRDLSVAPLERKVVAVEDPSNDFTVRVLPNHIRVVIEHFIQSDSDVCQSRLVKYRDISTLRSSDLINQIMENLDAYTVTKELAWREHVPP